MMDVSQVKENVKAGFLSIDPKQNGIKKVAELMDGMDKHLLKFAPWKEFSYMPQVSFSIAYSNDHIFLKYFVKEKEIRAHANQPQGPVWEDSCVEFFVSFDNSGYYNFEFNCIGNFLAAFGPSKTERQSLAKEVVKKIITSVSIVQNEDDDILWELTAAIPVSSFVHSSVDKLQDTICRANFYKCGDLLSDPHFVAWSNIESATPNFHLPEYFGALEFK
jgi:hypothetical protein